MLIKDVRSLETFKQSRVFVNEIYQLTNKGIFAKDFSLKDQLRRAAVSILLNIAEGFDSGSSKSFINFLRYSFRSSSEVKAIICIAVDLQYITESEYDGLEAKINQIQRMLSGLIKYLNKNN